MLSARGMVMIRCEPCTLYSSIESSSMALMVKAPHDDDPGERLEARRRDDAGALEPAREHLQLRDDEAARRAHPRRPDGRIDPRPDDHRSRRQILLRRGGHRDAANRVALLQERRCAVTIVAPDDLAEH